MITDVLAEHKYMDFAIICMHKYIDTWAPCSFCLSERPTSMPRCPPPPPPSCCHPHGLEHWTEIVMRETETFWPLHGLAGEESFQPWLHLVPSYRLEAAALHEVQSESSGKGLKFLTRSIYLFDDILP